MGGAFLLLLGLLFLSGGWLKVEILGFSDIQGRRCCHKQCLMWVNFLVGERSTHNMFKVLRLYSL